MIISYYTFLNHSTINLEEFQNEHNSGSKQEYQRKCFLKLYDLYAKHEISGEHNL